MLPHVHGRTSSVKQKTLEPLVTVDFFLVVYSKAQVESLLETSSTSTADLHRQLKGVMRVGSLAKGLLLHGDLDLELILLCRDRPTKTLLRTVYESLPAHFSVSTSY